MVSFSGRNCRCHDLGRWNNSSDKVWSRCRLRPRWLRPVIETSALPLNWAKPAGCIHGQVGQTSVFIDVTPIFFAGWGSALSKAIFGRRHRCHQILCWIAKVLPYSWIVSAFLVVLDYSTLKQHTMLDGWSQKCRGFQGSDTVEKEAPPKTRYFGWFRPLGSLGSLGILVFIMLNTKEPTASHSNSLFTPRTVLSSGQITGSAPVALKSQRWSSLEVGIGWNWMELDGIGWTPARMESQGGLPMDSRECHWTRKELLRGLVRYASIIWSLWCNLKLSVLHPPWLWMGGWVSGCRFSDGSMLHHHIYAALWHDKS